jgi:hypothetical protein
MNSKYATAKYLIHNSFMTAQRIGGSILLDSAMTEEEALEKIAMYKARAASFRQSFPVFDEGDVSRYTYIVNRAEWWSKELY